MGKCEKWTVAFRLRRGNQTIIDDARSPFTAISNTWRYWRADPFLFERDGKTFLFAELYDRLALRGVIGCCVLTERGASKWKIVIKEPFHLSYPFVFEHGGSVYMIPESFRASEIILYKAVSFPYEWKRVRTVADCAAVDSTIIERNGEKYLITVRVINAEGVLAILPLDHELNVTGSQIALGKEANNVRPAGKAFVYKNKLVRPSQDCSVGYGHALNLCEITKLDKEQFEERIICKILPDTLVINHAKAPQGVHTYNFTDRYEVIDYKEYEFGWVCKIAKAIKLIMQKLRKK